MTGTDDLTILRTAWADPAPPSPAAHGAARAALLERAVTRSTGADGARTHPSGGRFRRLGRSGGFNAFGLPRMGVRLAAVGVLAVALAAGITVAQNLGGADETGRPRGVVPGLPAGPVANAQEALGRAATAAEGRPFTPPRSGQWIYVESKDRYPAGAHRARIQTPRMPLKTVIRRQWTRADGKQRADVVNGRVRVSAAGPGTTPPSDYASLAALPRDPDALLSWLYQEMGGLGSEPEGRYSTAYGMFGAMLRDNVLPPEQEAAVYRALAKLPGVTLRGDAVDVAGRPAIAVGRVSEGWLSQELLLDRKTYAYLGERSIAIKDRVSQGLDGGFEVKKNTIQLLSVRTVAGIVDRPGDRP